MKFKNHTEIKLNQFGRFKAKWKIKLLNSYLNRNSLILDIGCAAGNISNFIPRKENYYGLEYNEEFIKFAAKKNIKIAFCDLDTGKLPVKNEIFDVVYFSHVIEHLEVRKQVQIMAEIYRVLKPSGKTIILAPTPYNWYFWDNATHVKPMTHGSLESMALDVGFKKAEGKYSLIRWLPHFMQRYLRLTPLRFFLWEVYMIARK